MTRVTCRATVSMRRLELRPKPFSTLVEVGRRWRFENSLQGARRAPITLASGPAHRSFPSTAWWGRSFFSLRVQSVPDYRFFLVASNGRIESPPTYITVSDDVDALMRALQSAGPDAGVEIWQADRFVCRIPAIRNGADKPASE